MQAKRLFCSAVRQLEWQTFDIPDTPEPHQIVVKTACSLISAGTEVAIYSGSHINYSLPQPPEWFKFPLGLGYALTGTIWTTGSEVQDWAVGDRVLVQARHGNWALADTRTDFIYRLPENVSMIQGALARMANISMVGVRQGKVTLGETVVILGLGLIGQFAAQLSYAAGARPVIGLDLITDRVEIATEHGIRALNPTKTNVVQTIADLTGGRMADVVIEATGNPKAVSTALDLAATGGRVVLLGSPRGTAELDVYTTVHKKGILLLGAHEFLGRHAYTDQDPWTHNRNQNLVLALFADGSLKNNGLISHRIQPDAIPDIYEALIHIPENYLGVLIDWDMSSNGNSH